MRKLSALIAAGTIAFQSTAEEPPMIASVSLPSIMDAAQNISDYSKKIDTSYPMLILGGIASLSFNPELSDYDFLSPIKGGAYSLSEGTDLAYSVEVSSKKSGPTVKLFGEKLHQKKTGDTSLISNSKEVLNKLTSIKARTTDSSLLTIEVFPSAYFKYCGKHYEKTKADFLQSKSNNDELIPKLLIAESIFKGTSRILFDVFTQRDQLVVKMRLKAVSGSSMNMLIKALDGLKGEVAYPLTDKRNDKDPESSSKLNQKLQTFLSTHLGDENKMIMLQKVFTHSSGVFRVSDEELICNLSLSPETVKQFLPSEYRF